SVGIAVGGDNKNRVLWNHTSGAISVWNISSPGSYTTDNYGPFAGGWTARSITAGNDNVPRILWNSALNEASLWYITAPSVYRTENYGPFSGLSAFGQTAGLD